MAKDTKKNNVPAQRGSNVPATQNQKPQKMLLPDDWYQATIFDIDPEYYAQGTGKKFVVLKIRLNGSLRFGQRTLNYYVGEEMETNRNDGGSTRGDLIKRFGVDVWENPDAYLDLVIRTHIGVKEADDRNDKPANRVISIYPVTWKGSGNGEGSATEAGATDGEPADGLDEEIPI